MKTKTIVCLMFVALFVYAGNVLAGTEGTMNTFYGNNAGIATTGDNDQDTFIGASAGLNNTTGSSNTFLGAYSGENNTTGYHNTFLGTASGYENTTGYHNTFIGRTSGENNTTGYENTFLGTHSGFSNITGTGNVFLGYNSGYNETGSNKLYIDNSNTSTPLIYGEFDNDIVDINGDLYVTGDTYMTSDARLKEKINTIESSLDKVMSIRGVSFTWKEKQDSYRKLSDRKHYGVIGQEIEKVLPEIVSSGNNKEKRVAYTELIPILIEAIKEQQKIISELSEKVEEHERKLKLRGSLASIMN